MGFAYRDKYGVLHVVEDRKTAEQFALGNIVETTVRHEGGYPIVAYAGKWVHVVDYGDKVFIDGNNKTGKQIDRHDPLLADLKPIFDKLG